MQSNTPEPGPRGGRRTRLLVFVLAAVVAASAGLLFLPRRQTAARPRARRALAVLGPRFSSATPQAGGGWVSGALAELVATELLSDPHLRVISPETVVPAVADLGLGRVALDADGAHRLQQRLGADLVVGGAASGDEGALQLDLVVYGTGDRPLAEATERGPLQALPELAERLSRSLRRALGDGEATTLAGGARGSFPESGEAARLYVLGIGQLRAWEPGAAAASLREAEALSAQNPRIEMALAEALLELQYELPARDAAARAIKHKEELPPEDRARLEILDARARRDREQAVSLARAFYAQDPEDLERGLLLARLQHTLAHQSKDALVTLAGLRKLPKPASTDPRIDLLAASAQQFEGRLQESVSLAESAWQGAQRLGARHEMGLALYQQASALRRLGKDPAATQAVLHRAQEQLREVNDLGNVASVEMMEATLLADLGDLPGAQAQMERALAVYRQVGARTDEAMALHNLSIVLRRLRDLPAAIERSQAAEALFVELGERPSAANALATLGNLRMDSGDLRGAVQALSESSRMRRELHHPQLIGSLLALTGVQVLQGDLREARRTFEEAKATGAGEEKQHAAQLREAEAQLAFFEGDLRASEAAALESSRLAAEGKQLEIGVSDEALLARTQLKQGRTGDARAAVERGQALLASSKTGIARGLLQVMDGRVKAAETPRAPAAAVDVLRTALAEATARGVAADRWEARLALAELEPAESRAILRGRLKGIAREARAQGFGLYAMLAEEASRR